MSLITIGASSPAVACLHAGHFAFIRAVVQGVDPRESWERYLRVEGAHGDIRHIRQTIGWIRAAFAAAAKRHGRPGTARLVVLELPRVDQSVNCLPSLENFIQAQSLENFSEAEQTLQFQQYYDVRVASHRRQARLIGRQLDALKWLQQAVEQAPQASDPIANWIDPALAIHLSKANLRTLEELVAYMECFGAHWWCRIDAIGTTKAARITQWVLLHKPTLGLAKQPAQNKVKATLIGYSDGPGSQRGISGTRHFMSLDQLILTHAVPQSGPLRAPFSTCQIAALDDLGAIRAWLNAKAATPSTLDTSVPEAVLGSLSHTQRAYWKEAERFMLWLILERQIGLSSLTPQDCICYREFLEAPLPAWCAQRGRAKWHPQWRPFEGPLSMSGISFALTVLKGLYRYLVKQRYLASSPWETVALPTKRPEAPMQRRFDACAWAAIDAALKKLPATSVNQRLMLVIALLSSTGLRVGQLARARANDFHVANNGDRGQLRVIDPVGVNRYLPLPLSLTNALRDYLRARGLEHKAEAEAEHNRGAYLLGMATDVKDRAPWAPCALRPFDPAAGIGAGTLRDQIKDFFSQCSLQAAVVAPLQAAQFAAASSEWLRGGRPGP